MEGGCRRLAWAVGSRSRVPVVSSLGSRGVNDRSTQRGVSQASVIPRYISYCILVVT